MRAPGRGPLRLGAAGLGTGEPGPLPGRCTVQLFLSVNVPGILLAPFLEGFGLTTCREQPGLPAFRTCETKYLEFRNNG